MAEVGWAEVRAVAEKLLLIIIEIGHASSFLCSGAAARFAEFEFRYNTRTANGFDDRQRAMESLKGIVGKRLTYRPAN